MTNITDLAQEFLAQKKIAVVGVSRTKPGSASANYEKLRAAGYQVYAVNPHTTDYNGDPCYPNLKAIPDKLDGVLVFTNAAVAAQVAQECVDLKIPRVWFHCALGTSPKFMVGTAQKIGSASPQAVELCRAHHIQVINGGCPMMFYPDADGAHSFMRRVLTWLGNFSAN